MSTKIVMIGAGYAGILTAKKLAKRFKKDPEVSITLIDRKPFHTMLTELHEVAADRVDEDSIRISLKRVFKGRKVDVRLDTITDIDFAAQRAIGEVATYDYDYLILAAGSKPTYFGVQGAAEHAKKLWSYDDAVALKTHIYDMYRSAASCTDPLERKKMLTFYVCGAGFTGVEMAGELAELNPILCEKFEIDPQDVRICIVDILPRCVPNLPEKLSGKIEKRLSKMGVCCMLSTGVQAIGSDFVEVQPKDRETIHEDTYTVIWAAGIEACDLTNQVATKLRSPERSRGRIEVSAQLTSVDDDKVYVIGDNMFFIPEGQDRPVPQMVENCEHSAASCAKNLTARITGKGELGTYNPSFKGVMVCVGGRYGVAHIELGKLKFNLPSFFAMFSKHFINLIYFVQVLGWNKIFSYMKHEFFTIRHDRSFVGGHFSNKTPSFLLVLLRIWLGAVYVFEAIKKISEGWMAEAKLSQFFGYAIGWFEKILASAEAISGGGGADAASAASTAATTAIADAASSASTAAVQAVTTKIGEVFINWNILGLFKLQLISGKTLAHSGLNDIAFRIDMPIMNWMVDKIILPNNSIQMVAQIFIVLAELIVGLCLMGGFLATPAAAFSLLLQVMFVMTTGLYLGTFWMIFAAIAVLIGSGRIFGLDYYLMPRLKKAWKKTGLGGKWYLYND